jgi:amino acid transporter
MSANHVSFFRAVQAVLWSFIGIRKNSEGQEDMAKLNPFHVLVVGLSLALMFVLGLIVFVNWVVAQPITLS